MAKIMNAVEATAHIKDGDSIFAGGFYANGTPQSIVDELIRQGQKDLIIYNNDGNTTEKGMGRLIKAGQVSKFVCTWFGRLPLVSELADKGELDLEVCPQGTFAERIRAGGFGLGGVLTATGLGTVVEDRWAQRVTLNGKDWLYHTPLRADVAIVEAERADTAGNLIFHLTQRSFATVMCFAADLVIAEITKDIVHAGELDPSHIHVPGICVDILVPSKEVKS